MLTLKRRYFYRGEHHHGCPWPHLLAILALQAGALVPVAAAAPPVRGHEAPGQRDVWRSVVTAVSTGVLVLALSYGLALVGMLAP